MKEKHSGMDCEKINCEICLGIPKKKLTRIELWKIGYDVGTETMKQAVIKAMKEWDENI